MEFADQDYLLFRATMLVVPQTLELGKTLFRRDGPSLILARSFRGVKSYQSTEECCHGPEDMKFVAEGTDGGSRESLPNCLQTMLDHIKQLLRHQISELKHRTAHQAITLF